MLKAFTLWSCEILLDGRVVTNYWVRSTDLFIRMFRYLFYEDYKWKLLLYM